MDSCLVIPTNTFREYWLDKRNPMTDGSFRISQKPSRGGCSVNFFEISLMLPDNKVVIYDPFYFDKCRNSSLYTVEQTGICVDNSLVQLTVPKQRLLAFYLSTEHILVPNLQFRCHEFAASMCWPEKLLSHAEFGVVSKVNDLVRECYGLKNLFHYENLIVQDDWNKVDQYFWIKLIGDKTYNCQMHSLLNMGNGVWLSKNMTTGLFATTLDQWLEIYPASRYGYMK
jgi:hypothetical protein